MPTRLHQIADKYVPRFANTFESSARSLAPKVTLEIIEEDLGRKINAHPQSLYALVDEMVIAKKVEDTATQKVYSDLILSVAASNGVVMDLDSPFVLDAAKKLTADLVTNVNKQTKDALRQMIFEAIRDGDAPLVAQKQIREIIGLTKRDAMLVKRMGAVNPEGTERLRAKLIRRRAITIARTETMRASNIGQKVTWQQMMSQGLLDPETFQQKWLCTEDDRLCELCAPMDGLTVSIDEDFEATEKGVLPSQRVPYQGEVVESPPLHVSCRCTVVADFGGD